MKRIKMLLDLVLIFALPVLMGYSLVSEFYHEIIGISIGVLFAVHIVLNRKWFLSLFKGRYSARRVVTLYRQSLACYLRDDLNGERNLPVKVPFPLFGNTYARLAYARSAYPRFILGLGFDKPSHGFSRKYDYVKIKEKACQIRCFGNVPAYFRLRCFCIYQARVC